MPSTSNPISNADSCTKCNADGLAVEKQATIMLAICSSNTGSKCLVYSSMQHLYTLNSFGMQGVQTCVGGFDLIHGIRMGRVDIRTPAVALMFSRDGSLLVVATQVSRVAGF